MSLPALRRLRAALSRRAGRRRCRGERGAVTAELALGLPLLLALTAGLVWLQAVGAAQVRVVDAAREVARAVARGDDPAAARAVGERIAPSGARVVIEVDGSRVVVVATARVQGPGGVMGALSGVEVSSEAVALVEHPG